MSLTAQHDSYNPYEADIQSAQKYLYKLALSLTKNHHDAQDLLQDTNLRIAKGIKTFRGDVRLTSWAHSIMRNIHIDTQKKLTVTAKKIKNANHLYTPTCEQNSNIIPMDSLDDHYRSIADTMDSHRHISANDIFEFLKHTQPKKEHDIELVRQQTIDGKDYTTLQKDTGHKISRMKMTKSRLFTKVFNQFNDAETLLAQVDAYKKENRYKLEPAAIQTGLPHPETL